MQPGLAARVSRFLVGCHPRRWRDRYGSNAVYLWTPPAITKIRGGHLLNHQ